MVLTCLFDCGLLFGICRNQVIAPKMIFTISLRHSKKISPPFSRYSTRLSSINNLLITMPAQGIRQRIVSSHLARSRMDQENLVFKQSTILTFANWTFFVTASLTYLRIRFRKPERYECFGPVAFFFPVEFFLKHWRNSRLCCSLKKRWIHRWLDRVFVLGPFARSLDSVIHWTANFSERS